MPDRVVSEWQQLGPTPVELTESFGLDQIILEKK